MLSASQESEHHMLGSCSPPFLGVDASEGSAVLVFRAVCLWAGSLPSIAVEIGAAGTASPRGHEGYPHLRKMISQSK